MNAISKHDVENVVELIAKVSPVVKVPLDLSVGRPGLLAVDLINGFCQVGCGPLAPAAPNEQVTRMIAETDRLARIIGPKLAFRDSHGPDQVEAPYPPHCIVGTGADELVDELAWLNDDPNTHVMPKDCIDGVVGGHLEDGSNIVFEWAKTNGIDRIIVVGICTDICVLNAVTSLLSARTRGFLGAVKDIIVHEPGCATYDLPLETARELGLPDTTAHPQAAFHQLGLMIMQNQGAIITGSVK